jgi:hypothetical protein
MRDRRRERENERWPPSPNFLRHPPSPRFPPPVVPAPGAQQVALIPSSPRERSRGGPLYRPHTLLPPLLPVVFVDLAGSRQSRCSRPGWFRCVAPPRAGHKQPIEPRGNPSDDDAHRQCDAEGSATERAAPARPILFSPTFATPSRPPSRAQGLLLKKIVESIKDLVTDANLECTAESLGLQVRGQGEVEPSPLPARANTQAILSSRAHHAGHGLLARVARGAEAQRGRLRPVPLRPQHLPRPQPGACREKGTGPRPPSLTLPSPRSPPLCCRSPSARSSSAPATRTPSPSRPTTRATRPASSSRAPVRAPQCCLPRVGVARTGARPHHHCPFPSPFPTPSRPAQRATASRTSSSS